MTEDMIGSTIKVAVTAENGNTFESDETEEVALYEALTLISAEQTGADQVTLTTSEEIDAEDKLSVKKGKKEVKITDTDYTENGAVITLADKIVSGAEYTVTLTPANGDDATSATFEGERAAVGTIEFLNDVLVMKDSKYSEGYAYVKGYDQFGNEISLSGLTVTPGVGKFKSFDVSTGKITIEDGVENGQTSPFMTIKEVPVFVQYQQGTTVLSAQANLTVSTMGYLANMEFGEIKKDGTMRDDERLTITELASKKYYIEILDAEDQYGNPLDADALEDQRNGDQKTLFVIPGDTGAFYTTGKFSTLKGQTILWLEDANPSRPGTMALTITGAGGKTFTTDVTIEDDPYIDTINVTYPQLNVNVAASDELEFSAVDQYGDAIDLWDVRPAVNPLDPTEIIFTDKNHMTNRETRIKLSGKARFNEVLTDAGKKAFKVTIDTATDGAAKSDIVSFVTTTAGMKVKPASVTVGARGTALKVKSDGTSKQLNANGKGGDADYNFNGKVQFEDANGKTMERSDADYPYYKAAERLTVKMPNEYKPTNFYWTLSSEKVKDDGVVTGLATQDGKYRVGDMTGATDDVYVVLWGTGNVLLDQKPFHFTQVQGTKETKFTATCADTLFVNTPDKAYTDSVTVKVNATTEKGETYEVKADRITLSSLDFPTAKNEITGKSSTLKGSGTSSAVVFVDGTEVGTVSVNYTDADPVPTKVDYGYEAKKLDNTGVELSKFGAKVTGAGPELFYTPAAGALNPSISIEDGKLTFTDANGFGDELTACIKDQYGQVVPTTTFKANGSTITDGMTFSAATKKYIVDYAAGSITGRFTMYVQNDFTASVKKAPENTGAGTVAGLVAAVKAANGNNKADVITWTGSTAGTALAAGQAMTVEAGDTLIIDSDAVLEGADQITVKGTVINNGTLGTANNWGLQAGSALENDGILTLGGDLTVTGATVTNNKIFDAGAHKVEVNNTLKPDNSVDKAGVFENAGTFTSTGAITGTGTWINNAGETMTAGSVNMTNANSFDNYGTATIATTVSGFVTLGDGSKTTAGGAYTATTTVLPGATAEVKDSTTTTAAKVLEAGNGGLEIAVTDLNSNTTVVAGSGSIDGAPVSDTSVDYTAFAMKVQSISAAVNNNGTLALNTPTESEIGVDVVKKVIHIEQDLTGAAAEVITNGKTPEGFGFGNEFNGMSIVGLAAQLPGYSSSKGFATKNTNGKSSTGWKDQENDTTDSSGVGTWCFTFDDGGSGVIGADVSLTQGDYKGWVVEYRISVAGTSANTATASSGS